MCRQKKQPTSKSILLRLAQQRRRERIEIYFTFSPFRKFRESPSGTVFISGKKYFRRIINSRIKHIRPFFPMWSKLLGSQRVSILLGFCLSIKLKLAVRIFHPIFVDFNLFKTATYSSKVHISSLKMTRLRQKLVPYILVHIRSFCKIHNSRY